MLAAEAPAEIRLVTRPNESVWAFPVPSTVNVTLPEAPNLLAAPEPATTSSTAMIISVPVAELSVVASVAPIVHAILAIVTAPEVEAEAWAAAAGVQVTAAVFRRIYHLM